MIFHKEELFDEFFEICKQTEGKYGKENFCITEYEDEIEINVVNKV